MTGVFSTSLIMLTQRISMFHKKIMAVHQAFKRRRFLKQMFPLSSFQLKTAESNGRSREYILFFFAGSKVCTNDCVDL